MLTFLLCWGVCNFFGEHYFACNEVLKQVMKSNGIVLLLYFMLSKITLKEKLFQQYLKYYSNAIG